MNSSYKRGAAEAAELFLKTSDYADSLAGLWGKVQPAAEPSFTSKALAGLAGGYAGGRVAAPLLRPQAEALRALSTRAINDPSPEAVRAALKKSLSLGAQGVGAHVLGTVAGYKSLAPAMRALTTNRRAAAIRGVAPKAALGLGATALAAGLANHLLSQKSDD